MTITKAYRGSIFHFLKSPETLEDTESYQYFTDGLLVVADGKIQQAGPFDEIKKTLPKDIEIIDYSGFLIAPGFIDAHVHYPQTEMIASYGEHLLEWLNDYVFPAEKKFKTDITNEIIKLK